MKIAEWRKQTDRNIRKIRNTSLKRIRKRILPIMARMETNGEPLTNWERQFLAKEEAAQTNGKKYCSGRLPHEKSV